jgi:renalase
LKVGIVGAGVCGLAAGRALVKASHEVVVFEKHHRVGGRLSTRREAGFVWDTGATSIAPRGKLIEKVLLDELDQDGLVKVDKPIYLHEGLRVKPGFSSGTVRYVYKEGIDEFAVRMAEGMDVRLDTNVESIERSGETYRVLDEEFDAVLLTAPAPQSSLLLWNLGESRPFANVRYRSCLSVLLGYQSELPPVRYHALLDVDQIHPLTWLSLESVKSPGRAPEGGAAIVAQLSAAFSFSHFETSDTVILETVARFIERLYGAAFAVPAYSSVVRWKYSQPESFASFERVNRKGSKVLVASDGLLGGHVEDAFEIGTRTAQLLVEED